MAVEFTQSYWPLIGPDGSVVIKANGREAEHRTPLDAAEEAQRHGDGVYTWANVTIDVQGSIQNEQSWAPTHIDYGQGPEILRHPGGVFYGNAEPEPGSQWRIATQPAGYTLIPMPGGGWDADALMPEGDHPMSIVIRNPQGIETTQSHVIRVRANA